MKVVIFCGGQGTRLREETEFRPKPMVPIGGKPILWHIMKTFAHTGHTDFVACTGYKGEMIKEYFLNYRAMSSDFTIHLGDKKSIEHHGTAEDDFTVTVSDAGEQAMTGARLLKAKNYIDDELFMVTYGDGLCDVDISKLIEFHLKHGKIATVTSVKTVSRFGMLKVDDSGSVEHFAEKPDIEGWINAGYFVFNRKVFDYLSSDPGCVLEQEPLQKLAEDGELKAFKHEGFFYAMDTYREFKKLNELWDKGEAPWAKWLSSDTLQASAWKKDHTTSGKTDQFSSPAEPALSAAQQ